MGTRKKRVPRSQLKRRAIQTLEFDKIRVRLAQTTSFSVSRHLAEVLEPSYFPTEVTQLQSQTRDAYRVLELRPNLAFDGATDIRHMAHAGQLGGQITGLELLQAADTFAVIHSARVNLMRIAEEAPSLANVAAGLADFKELTKTIRDTLTRSGDVVDHASDLLAQLRNEERQTQDRIQIRLEEIIASTEGQRVLQEGFVTTRGDRFVLAVKAEHRGQFKGLIHDISSTGASVFMEPLEIVEMGNAWRELKVAAAREADRILLNLTAMLGAREEAIVDSIERLGTLDLALAKGRLGQQMYAIPPDVISDSVHRNGEVQSIRLVDARHPTLGHDAVPMSLEMGLKYLGLVISGPNTGGKTVALKTVGLLALMAQAGLAIPASKGSSFKIFDGVYADIGDEQSIEQSLSTFSAHMTTIVDILKVATSESLVLLDEVGAGTDPQEGTALAKAILSSLVDRGATTLVTTHHSELKGFANVANGFENANVEFDPVTLEPTFRLVIGVPGRSNALNVAERLGIPADVLETAKSSVGQSLAEVELLLEDIQRQRSIAEKERTSAETKRREIETAQVHLQKQIESLEDEHRQALLEQRVEAQVMIEAMKSRLRHTGRRAKSLVGEKGRTELAHLSTEVSKLKKLLENGPWKDTSPTSRMIALEPGDHVRIRGLKPVAEVVSQQENDRVQVQAGSLRMEVPLDLIEAKVKTREPEQLPRYTVDEGVKRRARVGDELWVHGMRAQQAVEAVDEYIEKAVLAGHRRVRIIHGKGRGILREAIHHALDSHPLVGMFSDSDPEEGGMGVTIAEL